MIATTSKATHSDVRKAARHYIEKGWCVVPVQSRGKGPYKNSWQNLRMTANEVDESFKTSDNVGIHTGQPSKGLVDVDLDCPEAIELADEFLPRTERISGRQSSPRSHRWYYADPIPEYKKYSDTKGKNGQRTVLVELRAKGHQTLVPPSIHPSGQRIRWYGRGEPARVDGKKLVKQINELAACVELSRNWPAEGARNETALAVSGTLLPAGWSVEKTKHLITCAARTAGDEEWEARAGAVDSTQKRLAEGADATGKPTLSELIGKRVVEKIVKWSGLSSDSERTESSDSYTPATRLVELASDIELFHSPEHEPFATLKIGNHFETWGIKKRAFRRWLSKRFYDKYRKAAPAQALSDALGVLEGRALFEGAKIPVHVRSAEHDGAVYLDLGDDEWRVLKITEKGWKVLRKTRVIKFKRPKGMEPLPLPSRNGDIRELREFLNVEKRSDWLLIVCWLISVLRARGPFVVLVVQGEQGSAKSTAVKVLRNLVDPRTAPLCSTPRNEHDLMITAANNVCLAYDNVSFISDWLSDAFCRISTGGGFATRELYSNDEEMLFNAMRPIVLNGIDGLVVRPDLQDRSIIVYLPTIPKNKRMDEKTFWAHFMANRASILGSLLDILVDSLQKLPRVKLQELPRMADFAMLGAAAESAIGFEQGKFIKAYARNIALASGTVLESSSLATVVRRFIAERVRYDHEEGMFNGWKGTFTKLLPLLNDTAIKQVGEKIVEQKAWPKNAHALSVQLRRIEPNLRLVGIHIERGKTAGANSEKWIRMRSQEDSDA
jgi:hypothetical protein